MKALQNFQEGKETTDISPAEHSDKVKQIDVNSIKTIGSSLNKKKRAGWTFIPSASLEESLGRGGAAKSWNFLPGEGQLDQTNQSKGSERELDRMELSSSSVLRPEPGQLLGQVRSLEDSSIPVLKSGSRGGNWPTVQGVQCI